MGKGTCIPLNPQTIFRKCNFVPSFLYKAFALYILYDKYMQVKHNFLLIFWTISILCFLCTIRIQVFHVLEHQGTGGETLLVDGFFAAETLRRENPTAFKCLTETVVAHEFYDSEHQVRSLGTVLSLHPTTNKLLNIRYFSIFSSQT